MGRDDHSGARRPLTTTERALLDALLDHEFDGVEELRAQARRATASTGCECGCVTIDLHVPEDVPGSSAVGPTPVEGAVVDAAGEPIGGVLLFIRHGRLSGLEVHSSTSHCRCPRPSGSAGRPGTPRRPTSARRGGDASARDDAGRSLARRRR
ncbi:hypothetical protein [Blastococcus brunescens]|uniref:Uncharacterized protein n=1 Tax=Blastococcus brunescens TaxID=1564165 RepID=A0ABZ1AZT3_9ACTN|nr:hypothetical protein [Blastococcus sp. BMG 8361]WRL62569.1 hypothetical protein U6N30_21670 [Blastococcus sp. BMG 8361]